MLSFEYKHIHAYLFWETLWEWMNISLNKFVHSFSKTAKIKTAVVVRSKEAIL